MKKKLKGFTLVEVIIAFAVFSIMALILAMIAGMVGKTTYNTKVMNEKINTQSDYADKNGKTYNHTDDKVITGGKIKFNNIPVDVNTVEVNKAKEIADSDTNDTPNVKYFYVIP